MNQQIQIPSSLQLRAPSRVLMVAGGHIGNNIFCTPAIQLLRSALPATTLDVVALNAASARVFEGNAAVSSIFVVKGPWRLAWLASRYDEVICLHPKSASLLKHVAVPVSVIPAFDSHPAFDATPIIDSPQHHAEQILAFAASLVGCSIDESNRRYHLSTTCSATSHVAAMHLARRTSHSLPAAGYPRIGIHLGCGRTAIHGWKFFYRKRDSHPKLWPTEYYAALAEQLRHVYPDASFVITGTRNERFLARRFAKTMKNIIDLTGRTSVIELARVIDELDLFITQDCGVLHVASATSTPLLALFGPTCAASTGPWPPALHRQVLQGASMADITPEMAARAAFAQLQQFAVIEKICAHEFKEVAGFKQSRKLKEKSKLKTVLTKWIVTLSLWIQQYDFWGGGYAAFSLAGLL